MGNRDSRITGERLEELVRADEAVIHCLRAVPSIKTRLSFRMRIAVETRFAGSVFFERLMAKQTRKSIRSAVQSEHRGKMVSRVAIGVAAFLLASLVAFAGLTALSSSSMPGDLLYGLKKAKENLSVALSGSTVEKAEKQLKLGQERLSELDKLVSGGAVEASNLKYLASEYNKSSDYVRSAIQSNAGGRASSLESQLTALESQKNSIVSRVVATGTGGSGLAASGASIAVQDSNRRPTLGAGSAQLVGKTSDNGTYSFDYTASSGNDPELDLTVEQDGWKAASPLGKQEPGRSELTVSPKPSSLVVGKTQVFTLQGPSATNAATTPGSVYLTDRTGSSLINGLRGRVEVKPESSGVYSFSVTKTAVDVSRIRAEVVGLAANQAGDILTLGAIVKPQQNTNKDAVGATVYSLAIGKNSVELDNGLMKVGSGDAESGVVIGMVTPSAESMADSPLVSDTVVQRALEDADCKVETVGPTLVENSGERASYTVEYSIAKGGSTLNRQYRVTLGSGDRLASISCMTWITGSIGADEKTLESDLVTGLTVVRVTSPLKISGKTVADASTPLIGFENARPYATFDLRGRTFAVAYPSGCPTAWRVNKGGLSTILPLQGTSPGQTLRYGMMLGYDSEQQLDRDTKQFDYLEPTAALIPQVPVDSTEAFNVECDPPLESLKPGRQRITLTIDKLYVDPSMYFK